MGLLDAEYCTNLGMTYCERGLLAEGRQLLVQAVALDAKEWRAGLALGKSFFAEGEYEKAEYFFRIVLEYKPEIIDALVCLCQIYRSRNKIEKALACCRKAVGVVKDQPELYGFLADLELRAGNLYEGFIAYEWRKKLTVLQPYFNQFRKIPEWQGEFFGGKKLLVICEQSLGDTLQFIRYLPQVKNRGGLVTLYCQKPLIDLLQGLAGADFVTDQLNLLDYDLIIPLLSLPKIFATTLKTIPAKVPYLTIDRKWQTKGSTYIDDFAMIKVGLVWRSSDSDDATFSCSLRSMLPLANIPGVKFYSLQRGAQLAQIEEFAQWDIVDCGDQVESFSELAGLMSQMDLIISVDSTEVHLAGAINKPVWAATPYVCHWRWQLESKRSPWYPSLLLFRQEKQGDWYSVFTTMAELLRAITQKWLERKSGYSYE